MYGDYFQVQREAELMQMEAEMRRMQNPSPVIPAIVGGLVGYWLGRRSK